MPSRPIWSTLFFVSNLVTVWK